MRCASRGSSTGRVGSVAASTAKSVILTSPSAVTMTFVGARPRWEMPRPCAYPTARAAYQLARKLNVQTPIVDEVYAALYANKNVREGVQDLMNRALKEE